jgi:hypothetical protein
MRLVVAGVADAAATGWWWLVWLMRLVVAGVADAAGGG